MNRNSRELETARLKKKYTLPFANSTQIIIDLDKETFGTRRETSNPVECMKLKLKYESLAKIAQVKLERTTEPKMSEPMEDSPDVGNKSFKMVKTDKFRPENVAGNFTKEAQVVDVELSPKKKLKTKMSRLSLKKMLNNGPVVSNAGQSNLNNFLDLKIAENSAQNEKSKKNSKSSKNFAKVGIKPSKSDTLEEPTIYKVSTSIFGTPRSRLTNNEAIKDKKVTKKKTSKPDRNPEVIQQNIVKPKRKYTKKAKNTDLEARQIDIDELSMLIDNRNDENGIINIPIETDNCITDKRPENRDVGNKENCNIDNHNNSIEVMIVEDILDQIDSNTEDAVELEVVELHSKIDHNNTESNCTHSEEIARPKTPKISVNLTSEGNLEMEVASKDFTNRKYKSLEFVKSPITPKKVRFSNEIQAITPTVKFGRTTSSKDLSMYAQNLAQNSPKSNTNAFQFMMDQRHKVIGRNSPGKDKFPEDDEETDRNVVNLKGRKDMLKQWAENKGMSKRKLDDEEREEYIEFTLDKRAKRLKRLLNCDEDNSEDEGKTKSENGSSKSIEIFSESVKKSKESKTHLFGSKVLRKSPTFESKKAKLQKRFLGSNVTQIKSPEIDVDIIEESSDEQSLSKSPKNELKRLKTLSEKVGIDVTNTNSSKKESESDNFVSCAKNKSKDLLSKEKEEKSAKLKIKKAKVEVSKISETKETEKVTPENSNISKKSSKEITDIDKDFCVQLIKKRNEIFNGSFSGNKLFQTKRFPIFDNMNSSKVPKKALQQTLLFCISNTDSLGEKAEKNDDESKVKSNTIVEMSDRLSKKKKRGNKLSLKQGINDDKVATVILEDISNEGHYNKDVADKESKNSFAKGAKQISTKSSVKKGINKVILDSINNSDSDSENECLNKTDKLKVKMPTKKTKKNSRIEQETSELDSNTKLSKTFSKNAIIDDSSNSNDAIIAENRKNISKSKKSSKGTKASKLIPELTTKQNDGEPTKESITANCEPNENDDCVRRSSRVRRQTDKHYVDVPESPEKATKKPKKTTLPTRKTEGKIASVFLKSVPKPKIDPAVLEARKNFLHSPSPSMMKNDQVLLIENNSFDPFPTFSHIQQKTSSSLWSLQSLNTNLNPVFENYQVEISDRLHLASFTQCESSNSTEIKLRKIHNILNKRQILIDIKSRNPDYPVYKSYKLLKEKNRHAQVKMAPVDLNMTVPRKLLDYSCLIVDSEGDTTDNEKTDEPIEPVTSTNFDSSSVWTDKYKPTSSEDIIGNRSSAVDLLKFLKERLLYCNDSTNRKKRRKRKDSDSDDFVTSDDNSNSRDVKLLGKTLLIRGPHGSGKTSAIYAVCQELDINVLELNASSKRTGRSLTQKLQEATQSQQIHKQSQENIQNADKSLSKMCLLLVEDIDVVFEQDDGFLTALSQLLQTTKRPIILTFTDETNINVQKFLQQYPVITFLQLSAKTCSVWLQLICLIENVLIDEDTLGDLLEWTKGDLRRTLLQLQFWSLTGGDSVAKNVDIKAKRLEVFRKLSADETVDILDISETSEINESVLEIAEFEHKAVVKSFVLPGLIPKPYSLGLIWWNFKNILKEINNISKNKDIVAKENSYGETLLLTDDTTEITANYIKSIATQNSKKSTLDSLKSVSNFYEVMSLTDIFYNKSELNSFDMEPTLKMFESKIKNSQSLEQREDPFKREVDDLIELVDFLLEGSMAAVLRENNMAGVRFNMGVPEAADRRWRFKQHSCQETFSDKLPLSVTLDRKSFALDYYPTLISIVKSEQKRLKVNSKRRNRFYSYLRNLDLKFTDSQIKTICSIFARELNC